MSSTQQEGSHGSCLTRYQDGPTTSPEAIGYRIGINPAPENPLSMIATPLLPAFFFVDRGKRSFDLHGMDEIIKAIDNAIECGGCD